MLSVQRTRIDNHDDNKCSFSEGGSKRFEMIIPYIYQYTMRALLPVDAVFNPESCGMSTKLVISTIFFVARTMCLRQQTSENLVFFFFFSPIG